MAQYYLGEIYDNGSGVRENHKEAFRWYKQSSDGGSIPAMQKAAHYYLNGIGIRQNDEEGYMLLATLALYGDEESRTLLQSAAKSGNSFAEYGLGFYSHKQNDIETAYHWFEKSADKGNALAFHALAVLHGNDGDDELKLRYFRLAAEKGDAEAQILLSLALENVPDKKSPQNEEAFQWMKAAADQGHPQANYYLGNFYRSGTWVEADGQKAFECYSKAAEQGNSDGLDRLGECCAFGTGVMIDESLAFQYFREAAAMDNPKGQCNLGLCYLKGMGCHQDTELAFQWISRAMDSDNPIVVQILQSMGLDVGKLSGGYRQIQSTMMGDCFGGENSDRLFGNPSKILPIPPSEKGEVE